MKKVILEAGIGILKLVYLPLRLCRLKNKITYISRQADEPSEDFKILAAKIQEEHPEIETVALARKITGGKESVLSYPFHMLSQMYHLATSKVVIVDGYCIAVCVLPHKKETKVIQMWHAAAAIKKFGYQTIDKPSGSSRELAEIMQMHKNYDYVLASSEITGEHYCEAFGVSQNKIVYIGMPHYAQLLQFDKNEEMEHCYPELKQKKTILYIPTFRKGEQVQLSELVSGVDFENYNFVARLHPLDRAANADKRVIFDTKFTVYDWIKKADVVIADYSSLIIECAILEKELYLYLYDLQHYAKTPGLNVDFVAEGLEKSVFYKGKELHDLLEKEYDKNALAKFKEKYVEVSVKESADELLDFLLKIIT